MLVAAAVSLALLLVRLRDPLGADEGYLWFGVQQTLRRRMPHRDFKSYEPGRYFWSALLARICGGGLLVLRASTHLFLSLGLYSALLALRRLGLDWPSIGLAGILLGAWAHPQHKQFEHAWILIAWSSFSHALMNPTPGNLALASAGVGFSVFFGFNLFLYFGAAWVLCLMVGVAQGWLTLNVSLAVICAGGGLIGMLPFLFMLTSAGFARNFYRRRIGSVLARGTSNLPLPLPWPWRQMPAQFLGLDRLRRRVFSWLFFALFFLPISAAAMLLLHPAALGPTRTGAVGALALALFTSHHAASRADVAHIAQVAGSSFLLAILLTGFAAPWSTLALAGLTCWLLWPLQSIAQRRAYPGEFRSRNVGGLSIRLPKQQADLFAAAAAVAVRDSDPATTFFAAPIYPALYASLLRDSPVYDTFCVHPADTSAQHEMIAAMERAPVGVALISDAPIDGRDDLRFSRTHPEVWAYLGARFRCENAEDLGPAMFIFTAKTVSAICTLPADKRTSTDEPLGDALSGSFSGRVTLPSGSNA